MTKILCTLYKEGKFPNFFAFEYFLSIKNLGTQKRHCGI